MLKLFLIFLKIGLFTFGGGYAMIPLITEEATKLGMDTYMITDFIGISEATPGPFAINIATFIGYSNYGILGAILATIAIALPSFLTILIIAIFINKLRDKRFFKVFMKFTTPIIVGLVLSALIKIVNQNVFSITDIYKANEQFEFVPLTYISFALLFTLYLGFYLIKKKRISPFLIILISIAIGGVSYLFLL